MPPRTPTGTSGSSSNTSTAIDSTLKPTSGPTLKNLLKSADILLKPPTPLSSNPTDLIQRLKACSKSLPKEWRKVTPEWCNEDEQERPGDQNQNEQDEELRKRRRDELVFVVGKRCFALIKSIQLILEKEFWPKETRGIGMDERDCTFSISTHQLSRRQRKKKSKPKKSKRRGSHSSSSAVTSPTNYKYSSNPIPSPHHVHTHSQHHSHKRRNSYYSVESQFPIPKLFKSKRRPSADARYFNSPKSVLLGTADLRLIRLMLSHTTFSYLLPLASHYAESLPTFLPKTAESLSVTLESLLKLLKTTVPPTPDAGPSSRAPTPPTTITQTLLSSHLIPIFLSTLIIAYTPSKPSETYANLRSEFIKALMSLSPGHAISTLVNVLKLLVQGSKEGVKSNGWVRVWPKYPKEIINGLLTAQVRRPGGVRGLMENVLGETAKTDDVTSIEGQRLDHIFNVLIRIPRQVTPEIYYPWLLSELFAMIPLTSHSHLPVAYVNTACYCIQRLWASNRPLIGDWLKNKLHSPWYPKLPNSLPQNNDKIVVTSWEAIQRSVQNMRLLLLHNPSSHEFADFLVGSILPPLFSLHTFLNRHQDHLLVKVKKGSDVEINLEEGVQSLLVSWGKAVDEVAGVKGIWSIAESGRGWGGKESIEGDGVDLHWEKEGEGVKLVVSRDKAKTSQDDITLPSISSMQSSNEDSLAQFLARQIISPDPQLLCQLIESLDRPDIASEVILKALDSWRIKLATEIEPSLESLSNLQLTIQMMEKLGSQLFTRPSQVLGFVERVLHDQVQSLDGGDEKAEVEDEKPFIEEVNDGHAGDKGLNDDVAPDGKRGLIEVACQLLASLEGEGQLKEDLPILQPILSHLNVLSHRSPSVSIRNAAREAQLLLSQQHFPDHDPLVGPQQASRETYQKAITLIKDDTLPVKAHGLTMLKDLVFSVGFDTALVPNILGIYLEQLDDKDSFIYLSAIKGLSGMVDALGKDVFVPLIGKYTGEIEALERNEKKGDEGTIERVLRLAEAIDQVAERTGDALGGYANEIVPPLMSIYPLSSLPTVIRSSALSILSTCARVSPFTILPWANDLAQGTLDLIQVESVVSSPFKSDNIQPQPQPQEEERNPQMQWGKSEFVQLVDDDPLPTHEESTPSSEKPSNPRIVDEEPTLKEDGKHPTLRRAALSVFNWCVRVVLFVRFMDTAQSQDHEEQSDIKLQVPLKESIKITPLSNEGEREDQVFSDQFVQRALDILGYVQMRDDDEVVRQHAESALRDLKLLRNRGVEFEDGGLGLEGLKGLESLRIA